MNALASLDAGTRAALAEAIIDEARVREARRSAAAWAEYGPPTELGPVALERWQRDAMGRMQALLDEYLALPAATARTIWIAHLDAPPQAGKSETAKRFLSWAMAARGVSFGYASYAASLAEEHSQRVRMLLRSPEARRVWPYLDGAQGRGDERQKDTQADWTIASPTPDRLGAKFVARGRDGATTGRMMGAIVLDDMFKDAADYESPAAHRELDSFMRSAATARLLERGGLLFNFGTRWGVNDARGWLDAVVKQQRAAGLTVRVETWSYPLRAFEGDVMGRRPGEYLTGRWDEAKEAAARIFYGRHAAAILDGRPIAADGGWVKRANLRYFKEDPARKALEVAEIVITVDPAGIEEHVGEDSTAMHAWGRVGDCWFWLGREHGRWGISQAWSRFQGFIARFPAAKQIRFIEATVNGLALARRCDEHGVAYRKLHTKGKDKHTRGADFIYMTEQGRVYVPDPDVFPEWRGAIDYLCAAGAPGADMDDFDAAAWMGQHATARLRGSVDATLYDRAFA